MSESPRQTGGPQQWAEDYEAEVAALSRHLAAVEAYLYPLARRRLPDGAQAVSAQQHLSRELEKVLRLIETRLTGDVFAVGVSLESEQAELEELLEKHAKGEHALVTRLESELSDNERDKLLRDLKLAERDGPTRPHPYAPHPRGLERVVFHALQLWDRLFDTMDARVIPHPPERQPGPLSRWGRYVLGSTDFPMTPAPDSMTGSGGSAPDSSRREG
jgi:hypothetical protein